jgi:hypothetical protein
MYKAMWPDLDIIVFISQSEVCELKYRSLQFERRRVGA